MADVSRITVAATVQRGKPVVRGTRITVEHLLEELGAGTTVEELLVMHPTLSRADIAAAVDYAVAAVRASRGVGLAS